MSALCLSTRRPKNFTCEEVCKDVLLMNTLAKARRAKRFESGSLSLNVPKLAFKLDDNGNPIEFEDYPIRDSNKLVEVGPECHLPTVRVRIKPFLDFFQSLTRVCISHQFKLRACSRRYLRR